MNLKEQEMSNIYLSNGIKKDILIVVHNQLYYLINCIESIYKNTENFNLFIWDNSSESDTSLYLKDLKNKNKNVNLFSSNTNLGFIVPNNLMAKETNSPYLILLNSDTVVRKFWDQVLIGFLEKNKDVLLSGFCGGLLDEFGIGKKAAFGYDCDYICGYCMCFSRSTYEEFGLFDEKNLNFAYFEDSDFSLRIKEKNKKIYACYSNLVYHYQNQTSLALIKDNKFPYKEIEKNKIYFNKRWKYYLKNKIKK